MGLTQILGRQIVEQGAARYRNTVQVRQAEAVEDGPQHTFDACGTFDASRHTCAGVLHESVRVRPPAARRARGAARGDLARADAPTLSPPARQWPGFSQIFSSRRSQILFSSSRPAGRRQCAAIGSRRSTRCVRTRTPSPTTPAAGAAGICRMLGEDGSTTNGRRRPPAGFAQFLPSLASAGAR